MRFRFFYYPFFLLGLLYAIPAIGKADTTARWLPQAGEKSLTLVTGIHWQRNADQDHHYPSRIYAEAGLHFTHITSQDGAHAPGTLTYGPSLEFSPGKTTIYGLKFGGWCSVSALSLGLSTVYYTNFDKGSFRIRPELGFGGMGFRLVMGLNIATFDKAGFPELQKSWVQFSLNCLIRTKTIKKADHADLQPYK